MVARLIAAGTTTTAPSKCLGAHLTPGTVQLLLFCVACGTDWQRAGVTGETITALLVRGLIVRDARAHLVLTDEGRAALRALLPGL